MKFGVVLPTFWPEASPEAIRSVSMRVEELGYDSVWTADHVMVARSDTSQFHSVLEALTVLSWVAAWTTRVSIGTSVLVLPQRHAVLVAKQVATLDVLSGGRMILGVGAGWSELEFGYLGSPFAVRGAVMNEAISLLRHLWSGDETAFVGEHYAFSDHTFAPLPVQKGGPEIWVGGNSTAAMRRAARIGDSWHGGTAMAELPTFEAAAAVVRREAGDRDVKLTLHARVGNSFGWRIDPTGSDVYQGTRQYVIGGGEQAVEYFDSLRSLGCRHVAINFWDRDLIEMQESIERFAEDVLPAFRVERDLT
jgi:probable F420-dependent oxidoreductase